jgi:D-alanyl-lipoteichoic acid acyltransferase DltB (MBOAT superfamily)
LVAISYILCLDMTPLSTMKQYMFPDKASQLYQGYLTSILLACMNARCVSFALDRIMYKEKRETLVTSFLMVTAFCFYLPLCVMGPLVSSKTFKDSFEKPLQPLDKRFCVNILRQSLRYAVWFTVIEISQYCVYQQAFTLHVSISSSSTIYISLPATCKR